MLELPPRYEPLRRLGAGGGGEVWSVRDRIGGRVLAFKLLAKGAGAGEIEALVREAVALSGLEGLGVPRVVAFGALPDGRRYMVRELVEGRSLESVLAEADGGAWIDAVASACDQLTVIHRAGLLHGDIKPANVIVAKDGHGTLVDMGLAAPWRDGGTATLGLTPRYAAPELLRGEPLTVRAEVFAIGATLLDALSRRGGELPEAQRAALTKVAERATEESASARWPSVDEIASALRRAAGLPAPAPSEPPWPVVGVDGAAQELLKRVRALPSGGLLVVDGPHGSGRTTLLRRLAWTLGIEGRAVAFIDAPANGAPRSGVVDLEIEPHASRLAEAIVIVDDEPSLDEAARSAVRHAARGGARLVVVASGGAAMDLADGAASAFELPPLEPEGAADLVRRSVPSLSDALRARLVERTGRRPGPLRAAIRRLQGRAVVCDEDVDRALEEDRPSSSPANAERSRHFEEAERALDRGRFDEAASELSLVGTARSGAERLRLALARARMSIGRGDATGALEELDAVEESSRAAGQGRLWATLRARACLRAGRYAEASALAEQVLATETRDACAADAMSIHGVALAFTGEDARARETLDRAVAAARALGDPRIEAVALGSAAIAHQRAGRTSDARVAYAASLAAAEKAQDAATVATMRLNLAGVAQAEGDLAQALVHLEAAVDMGRRAGIGAAVTQALLNLANLDLYLGRWSRARSSIDQLEARKGELSAGARAQLSGLEAEHAARTGDAQRASNLYEETAQSWEGQGRPHDAAEARLEGLLARARAGGDVASLARELDAVPSALGSAGFGEHESLAQLVRGVLAQAGGNDEAAGRALGAAIRTAEKAGRSEWAWQALDARARLFASQGSTATARRDTEAALAMLEETAAKLPRDLREVFWDDPRRRALRQAHTATVVAGPLDLAIAPNVPAALSRPGATSASGTTSMFTGKLAEDRLQRIFEITRELASEHDMNQLLQRVTDHAVALLGAERGFVLLVGDKGEIETHTSRTRTGADDPHARFSRSVAERVVETGEPVVTSSARDDQRLAAAVSVHQLMIQSIACVPIRGAPPVGRTIGALYVETRLRPGVRFEREVPTLVAFADQAAIAIENARLLEENRARADELAHANAELESARDALARTLGKRTEQLAEARRDLKQVRAELKSHFGYAGLVGTSAAMRRVYALIERVKDTDVPLLVTGESGTGKEMVARAVHQAGPRSKRPFLGLNCGAIPANLLESELFGSVRGAFTGADRDRRGLFQEADDGTLLLDEIGEMSPKMQVGLLRVLQEKRVRPVGAPQEHPVNVRVIAATHRDLAHMVAEGTFRPDLYYRLHVVELHVPALRERIEDIPLLLDFFISLFATRYRRERKTVARAALRKLCAYPWPGNVRQLEHVLLSAWLMTEGNEIGPDDLEIPVGGPRASVAPERAAKSGRPRDSAPPAGGRAESKTEFKAVERERILSALAASNWNRGQAAKLIGLPRRTFYRRLKEFGIV